MNRRMPDVPPSGPAAVSAVVLAAGSARRMNDDKLLLELGGRPIVREVVEQAIAAAFGEVLVVVRAGNAPAVTTALASLPVRFVENERALEGMGTSIAAGARAVSPRARALVLLQGDQPFVGADMLLALIEAWDRARLEFVAARFGTLTTTPVLFDRALFAELAVLDGDRGARAVLGRHAGREIEFPEWRGADVDTPDDYARARALAGGAGAPGAAR